MEKVRRRLGVGNASHNENAMPIGYAPPWGETLSHAFAMRLAFCCYGIELRSTVDRYCGGYAVRQVERQGQGLRTREVHRCGQVPPGLEEGSFAGDTPPCESARGLSIAHSPSSKPCTCIAIRGGGD